jgi:hypothetical protein
MAGNRPEDRTVVLLERIVKLLTVFVTKGPLPADANMSDRVVLLSSVGLQPKEIADLLGTTPNIVSARISEAKSGHSTKVHRRTKK